MLAQLYIQNIAVIEKASVEPGSGLTVLTGETGAGKSILIGSINAITGGRVSRDSIRTGAEKAIISALFTDLPAETKEKIISLGFEPDESGDLLLSRTVTADGKSVCRINGQPATVSALREVSDGLVDLHGQQDSRLLMMPERHIDLLDSFAGLRSELAEYGAEFHALRETGREIESLRIGESEKQRQMSVLEFQIEEITLAEPVPGEDEELDAQRRRIQNAAKLEELFSAAEQAMAGDEQSDGALAELDRYIDGAEQLAGFFPELEPAAQRAQELYYELEELHTELRGYHSEEEFNPALLDAIESRLDLLFRLKQKYGGSVEQVLVFREEAQKKLDDITFSEQKIAKLEQRRDEIERRATELAHRISERRHIAAEEFSAAVCGELEFLDMPSIRFEVQIEPAPLGPQGADRLEFLLSTNPGEPMKPLSKIASGGELARIMLSIKNVLAGNDGIETMIFDEVDSGVSGRAAYKIGRKLKQVSRGRQVICVTHLAQVAAFADAHFLIRKDVRDGKTYTEVVELDRDERIRELARITGGGQLTEIQLKNAEELLESSSNEVE